MEHVGFAGGEFPPRSRLISGLIRGRPDQVDVNDLKDMLDPAQNHDFRADYLGDVTLDLAQRMFVATANSLETISPPLLDRCEVIECSGCVMIRKSV